MSTQEEDDEIYIAGTSFSITICKETGKIKSWKSENNELLLEGPALNLWRAPIDNDFGNNLHKRSRVWRNVQDRIIVNDISLESHSSKMIQVTINYEIPDTVGEIVAQNKAVYSIYGSGDIIVKNDLQILKEKYPEIPRFGMSMIIPSRYNSVTWYGRGPHESYWDRKTSAFVGIYDGKVLDQYWPYIRPQENGNKTDVRWMTLVDDNGSGFLFTGMPLLSMSVHHNLLSDFESLERSDGRHIEGVRPVNRHTTDVTPRDLTCVNIDYKQMGVGGDNSWGAKTHEKYRLTGRSYSYTFRMQVINSGDNIGELANIYFAPYKHIALNEF